MLHRPATLDAHTGDEVPSDLPPLRALLAFEAVARSGTMRIASDELGISHTVVSRHIRRLETWLQAELVTTSPRGVSLTPTGDLYARKLRKAFGNIAEATTELRPRPHQRVLRIWCVSGLATYWLAHRLDVLRELLPEVDFSLRPFERALGHDVRTADIIIGYAIDDERPEWSRLLWTPDMLAVASPSWTREHPELKVNDLPAIPLLHEAHKSTWSRWLSAVGAEATTSLTGPTLVDAAMCIDAAAASQGVALAPDLLCVSLFKKGVLEQVVPDKAKIGSYYFLASPQHSRMSYVRKLEDWLRSELALTLHSRDDRPDQEKSALQVEKLTQKQTGSRVRPALHRGAETGNFGSRMPPLGTILAFDALARHGTMRAAAQALGVGHSLVSRQFASLQARLGLPLAVSGPRGVRLTREGDLYANRIGAAIAQIRDATAIVKPPAFLKCLRIVCVTGLAIHWLTPRLNKLQALFPETEIVLRSFDPSAREGPDDTTVVIAYETTGALPANALSLLRPRMVPVASPAWIAAHAPIVTVGDLARHTLLHEETRQIWLDWFEQAGFPQSQSVAGPMLWDAGLGMDAAIAGQGVALIASIMLETAVERGQLVEVIPTDVRQAGYYLTVSERLARSDQIARLAKWLSHEMAETEKRLVG